MDISNSWEFIVAGLAIAAGLWGHIKGVGRWFKGLAVVTVWLDVDAVRVLTSYLATNGKRLTRARVYAVNQYHVKPLGKTHSVVVEWLHRAASIYLYKGRPIWVSRQDPPLIKDSVEHAASFLRGTLNMEKLLVEAADWEGESGGGSCYHTVRHTVRYHHGRTLTNEGSQGAPSKPVRFTWSRSIGYRLLKWNPEDLGAKASNGGLEQLALAPEIKKLTNDLREWYGARKWYEDRGIPWRTGCAYEGGPGTGKTSHARALAVELDLPVHVFDLATMSNEDLRASWSVMVADAPCMAIIEDVDAVFDGRTNVSKQGGMMSSGGLTFDALLNCIDGIERSDGVLFIVTTNHIEKLDPALLREGRVDRVVTFLPLGFEARFELARKIIDDEVLALRVATESGDTPAARFAAECCRVALAARSSPPSLTPYR